MNNPQNMEEMTELLKQLIDAKNTLSNGLSQVKVAATQERDQDVITAVRALFGDQHIKDGKTSITFKMLTSCLDTIRLAGKDKAKELIK